MKTPKPPVKKRGVFTWKWLIIFAILVLTIAGAGLTLLRMNRPAPLPPSAVVRAKVPPMPPPMPGEKPEIKTDQPEPALQFYKVTPPIPQEISIPEQAVPETIVPEIDIKNKDTEAETLINETPNTIETISSQIASETKPEESAQSPEPEIENQLVLKTSAQEIDVKNKDTEAETLINETPNTIERVSSQIVSETKPEESAQSPEPEVENQLVSKTSAQETKNDPILTDSTSAESKPKKTARFTIQVGAYLTKAYADDKMAELIDKGYDPFIFETTDAKQRKWHIVRFGHFESWKEAILSLTGFKQKEKMPAIIAHLHSL